MSLRTLYNYQIIKPLALVPGARIFFSRREGQFYGLVIDSPMDPLKNLRSADDVMMFSANRSGIAKMIVGLSEETKRDGL